MSSKNKLFLVVESVEGCRYKNITTRELQDKDASSGHIVIRKPCNAADEFEVHRGSRFWVGGGPVLVNRREGGLPLSKVVAVTEQEFDTLLGTSHFEDKIRLDLHSSGRLKWASLLQDGDAVQVKLDEENAPVAGVIKAIGTRFPPLHGLLFVVEITVG